MTYVSVGDMCTIYHVEDTRDVSVGDMCTIYHAEDMAAVVHCDIYHVPYWRNDGHKCH